MLNKILAVILCVLVVAIVGGTIIAFATGTAAPGVSLRVRDPSPTDRHVLSKNKMAAYTGFSRIRAVTKPASNIENDIGTPLVITPWFTYPENNTAFYEEIARKSGVLQNIIILYFANYTEMELMAKGEDKIKNELLSELNAQLMLGKIPNIYFTDYIFLK